MTRALGVALAVCLGFAFSARAEENAEKKRGPAPTQANEEAAAAQAEDEAAAPQRSGAILVARVEGTINPASADYLVHAIQEAEETRVALLLIELDTPGGALTSTQAIVRAMLRARVPIAVFVPRGGWAASAGTFITLASHIAAMAPGSSIGAAHPIAVGGDNTRRAPDPNADGTTPAPPSSIELEKAENFTASFIASIAEERGRNVEWAAKAVRESVAIGAEEAKRLNVIDLVAPHREALLEALDGRTVTLDAGAVRLDLEHAQVRELEMGVFARILHGLADPTWAFLLLMAGAGLIWLELNTPGVGVAGVLGTACLIVGAVALQLVPFSWLGLGLFAGGCVLVALELYVSSYGLMLAAGLVCMLLGGSMIFDRPDVSDLALPFWGVVVPVVATFAVFGGLAAWAVGRTLGRPSKLGEGELVGMRGVASTALAPSGTVALRGELWSADADAEIAQGEAIEVTHVEGMRLRVRRAQKKS